MPSSHSTSSLTSENGEDHVAQPLAIGKLHGASTTVMKATTVLGFQSSHNPIVNPIVRRFVLVVCYCAPNNYCGDSCSPFAPSMAGFVDNLRINLDKKSQSFLTYYRFHQSDRTCPLAMYYSRFVGTPTRCAEINIPVISPTNTTQCTIRAFHSCYSNLLVCEVGLWLPQGSLGPAKLPGVVILLLLLGVYPKPKF